MARPVSRRAIVRGILVRAVTSAIGGGYATTPLIGLVVQKEPTNTQFVSFPSGELPLSIRCAFWCAVAGASVPFAALIWGRFAERGPYLRKVLLLLSVMVISCLMATSYYVLFAMRHYQRMAAAGIRPTVALSNLPIARIPQIGAVAVLVTGMGLAFARSRQGAESQVNPVDRDRET